MKRIGTGKLREQNDYKILDYLCCGNEVTKRELSNKTGLTFATIGNIINDFLKNNIIVQKEVIQLKKGRPSVSYQLNPEYFHSLSLFIYRRHNKNYVHYRINNALLDNLKEEVEELKEITETSILQYIKNLINIDSFIKIIGIGIPSIISNGIIIESDIHELKGMNIEDLVSINTGIRTIVKNDMNFCAYGLYEYLDEKRDLCYLTFPKLSGPGCGTMINGHLLEGKNNIAGEILYLPFFEYVKKRSSNITYTYHNIALCISCLYSIINPSLIILSGEEMERMDIDEIKKECLKYIPEEFIPEMIYKDIYDIDYMNGIQKYINKEFLKAG